MRILKTFLRFIICICCISVIFTGSFAETNLPSGEIGDYGNWLAPDNVNTFKETISHDFDNFQPNIDLNSKTFVPIEAKLGLILMRALSAIDSVLQSSLVNFTVLFLLIMYVFWVGLEAYKTIRDSTDYKDVIFSVFKQGIIIVLWIAVLKYGPAKIFSMIMSPILSLGTYLSNFILATVADTYKVNLPDTCGAIHNYVSANNMANSLLIDPDTAADIMCLPARVSVFFYHAISTGFGWIKSGIGNSITMVIVGIFSVGIFIKCVFKYAFMTLGIVADLFLRLLMLPFTALAESMPSTSESNYAGQVFKELLSIFKADKISSVLSVVINATLYFISLSIIIAICSILLSGLVSLDSNNEYAVGSAMMIILTGCIVLYFAGKAEELAGRIGGKINNSFGKQLESDVKTLWGHTKAITNKLFKAWLNS